MPDHKCLIILEGSEIKRRVTFASDGSLDGFLHSLSSAVRRDLRPYLIQIWDNDFEAFVALTDSEQLQPTLQLCLRHMGIRPEDAQMTHSERMTLALQHEFEMIEIAKCVPQLSTSFSDHELEGHSMTSGEHPKVSVYTYVCCLIAASSSLLLGYDIGVFSIAITYIKKDLALTDGQQGVLIGMFNILAALGVLIAGPTSDRFGRKKAMMMGSGLFLIGTFFALWAVFEVMFAGRVLMGLGAGIAFLDPELYAAELSPPSVRGVTASFGELLINAGILVGFFFGWLLSEVKNEWRWMVGGGILPPILTLIGLCFIAESPRWLCAQDRFEEAKAIVARTADYTDVQVADQITAVRKSIKEEAGGRWRDLFCPTKALRQMMIVGWGVAMFQQANGSEGVVYFTPTILQRIGIKEEESLALTVAIGGSKMGFVLLAMCFIERFGRRPLYILSSSGCAVCLFVLGLSYHLPEAYGNVVSVTGLCMFMAAFSIGYGPLTGVILSEVFPTQLRGRTMAIGWALNRFISGLVALTFLSLTNLVGSSGAFMFYASITVVGMIYGLLLVPETRGKTLEQILNIFYERAGLKASDSPKIPMNSDGHAATAEHTAEEEIAVGEIELVPTSQHSSPPL